MSENAPDALAADSGAVESLTARLERAGVASDVTPGVRSRDYAVISAATAPVSPPTPLASASQPPRPASADDATAGNATAGPSSAPAPPPLVSAASSSVVELALGSRASPPPAPANPPSMRTSLQGLRTASGPIGAGAAPGTSRVALPPSLQAKMAALVNQRSGSPNAPPPDPTALLGARGAPFPGRTPSAAPPGRMGAGGLAARRPGAGLNLAGMGVPMGQSATGATARPNGAARPRPGGLKLPTATGPTPFSNFNKIVDPSGRLNFENKAVLHASGVDFSSGASFSINMGELELQGEIGHGNYGTVQKVKHKVTKVTMAMKEIRLELDDSKLKGIITELDILHRATSEYVVDFFGAFFIESNVYYCMEFMDAGSLENLSGLDVSEGVLARVTISTVRGLRFLKDNLQIMHRDIKPSNVLVSTAGLVKLCDFGVSGQLERSLAKTNIGCQSYMAPERIKGESIGAVSSYTVSSDVWSLGLTLIEFVMGRYPYPPETYSNVFAQLQAIVHGDPPTLPRGYSPAADDFVAACLRRVPEHRPTYAQLLEHPFLLADAIDQVDMRAWVAAALAKRAASSAATPSSATSSTSSSSSSSRPPVPPLSTVFVPPP